MAVRRPILVTGATGMVGRTLVRDSWPGFRCIAVGRGAPPELERGNRYERVDLTQPGVARALMERIEPEVVLHCAADSSLGRCEQDPATTAAINLGVTMDLARACTASGAYLIFCSTDQVFDGSRAPYQEDSPPTPMTEYGRQKAEAERLLSECGAEVLILRLALVLGISPERDRGAVDMLRPEVAKGKPVGLFDDEWRTPVSVDCLRELIMAAADRRPTGILNAGGRDRVDRVELGHRVAKAFGWPLEVEPRSREIMPYPRPADVSMTIDRRVELGLPQPAPLDEALARLAAKE